PYLEKAVRLRPDLIEAHAALGGAYLKENDYQKAVVHLERARAQDPDGSVHFQLARAYRMAGDTSSASRTMKLYQQLKQSAESAGSEQPASLPPPQ
ncbi:MAG: tetratricopeptide repeat protein, partial [Bryobacteraceae bacterium]